jgi:hypothetical protein
MTTELAKVPTLTPGTVSVLTPQGYEAALGLAKTLVESGFLPRVIQKPAQALAIILAGQELGLPPMQSLRQIHVVEGKPVLSAELMLSLFKRRGGRARWIESTDEKAVLWLRHPNGDEHTETWTIQEAQRAGVTGKDNWRKYGKAMLKARCISAGIRALGEADGIYEPEELGAPPAPEDLASEPEYTPPKGEAPSQPSPLSVVPAVHSESVAASTEASAEPQTREPGEDSDEGEVPADLVECWRKVEEGHKKNNTYRFEFIPMQPEPRCSPEQHAIINELIEKRGLSDDDWKAGLLETFNKQALQDLSFEEASRLIDTLNTAIKRWGSKRDTAAARDARKSTRAAGDNMAPEMRQMLEENP